MKHTIRARVTAASIATTLLVGGLAALAPSASADSRCNTRNHTHGALFWQRTDHFVGTGTTPLPGWTAYFHTSSTSVLCR